MVERPTIVVAYKRKWGNKVRIKVFKNLRAENRWTHNNNLSDQVKVMNHWSRTNLLKTFNPKDSIWQKKLIDRGLTVFKISERYLKNL